MKNTIIAALLALGQTYALACQPIGWVLVEQKPISITERLCVWQKSDVRVSRIVNGFCPLNPC